MRILLVDDHPLVRDGLRAAISRFFFATLIVEAGTSAEALKQAALLRPHLNILDINLPDLNGLDLARRLRAIDHGTKILFLAAEADPWTVREALRVGACGYLTKTNAAKDLHEAICAVMAGKVFLCQAAAAAVRRAEQSGAGEPEPPGLAILSPREREVLKLIAEGHTTKAIAEEMKISPKTVETHRQHIMRKLRTDNIASLTYYAIRHGLRPV
jgi:DNA-binding NarL/FixJ family response regulator